MMQDTMYPKPMMRYLVITFTAIFAMAFMSAPADAQSDNSRFKQTDVPENADTLAHPQDDGSRFYDGFESGYSAGYKSEAGLTSEPVEPVKPISPVEAMPSPSDPTDDFEHGLAVGRIQGMMDESKP